MTFMTFMTNEMNEKWLSEEIFSRYGEVKRARSYFLYTEKGTRLTDMYMENGRAILGWDGGKARLAFKNVLEKSQTGFFLTHYNHQLEKAVQELFPLVEEVAISTENEAREKKIQRWYPHFFQAENPAQNENAFYFVPPFPFSCDKVILCAKSKDVLQSLDVLQEKNISPPLLAAFTRSIYDLIAFLQNRSEEDFRTYDKILLKYFLRNGIYLFPKIAKDDYKNFVLECLECAIVINPNYDEPSIVPLGVDEGVFRKLEKMRENNL